LALIVAVVIGGALSFLWRQWDSAERVKTNKAIAQSAAPQRTPAPTTPPPGNASRWKEYLANNPPVPASRTD
jgi:hypothetical protein